MTFLAFLALMCPNGNICWDPVTRDCRGGLEMQPVRYQVDFDVLAMRMNPDCPLDEMGRPQACLSNLTFRLETAQTQVTVPEPSVGECRWNVMDPVSLDPAGNRSDGCQ